MKGTKKWKNEMKQTNLKRGVRKHKELQAPPLNLEFQRYNEQGVSSTLKQ